MIFVVVVVVFFTASLLILTACLALSEHFYFLFRAPANTVSSPLYAVEEGRFKSIAPDCRCAPFTISYLVVSDQLFFVATAFLHVSRRHTWKCQYEREHGICSGRFFFDLFISISAFVSALCLCVFVKCVYGRCWRLT